MLDEEDMSCFENGQIIVSFKGEAQVEPGVPAFSHGNYGVDRHFDSFCIWYIGRPMLVIMVLKRYLTTVRMVDPSR